MSSWCMKNCWRWFELPCDHARHCDTNRNITNTYLAMVETFQNQVRTAIGTDICRFLNVVFITTTHYLSIFDIFIGISNIEMFDQYQGMFYEIWMLTRFLGYEMISYYSLKYRKLWAVISSNFLWIMNIKRGSWILFTSSTILFITYYRNRDIFYGWYCHVVNKKIIVIYTE